MQKTNIVFLIVLFVFSGTFMQGVFAAEDDELEAELRKELERIEQEERALQQSLDQQKGVTATIQGEVNTLTNEIKASELFIDKKNVAIQRLGSDIALKDQTLQQLNEKMASGKKSLARLISQTHQTDDQSLVEIVLAHETISDFFVEADSYFDVQRSLEELFDEIREIRGLTEEERIALEQKQREERDIKAEIEYQKRVVENKKAERDVVLDLSKTTEATYEQILAEKRARAASIRAALFRLRDTEGISFGDALRYANAVSRTTGVRPAFILAILKQESELGKNVGQCNLPGDAPEHRWDQLMPGPVHYANYVANGKSCVGAASPCSWRDDQTIFKRITKDLGRDYQSTPLSCRIASVGGWGGAMGPSQFIPTTWASYEDRVTQATGAKIADPWNPEHAFTATALYLRDLGAAAGGYSAEHTAAAQYYAGGNYLSGPGQSYGTSVLAFAADFQEQIDFLNEVE